MYSAKRSCPLCSKSVTNTGMRGGLNLKNTWLTFTCAKCDHRWEDQPPVIERRKIVAETKERWRQSRKIHTLWHKFERRFKDKESKQFKLDGYKLMQAIELVVGKPGWEGLHEAGCDDSYHAGSSIYLIDHEFEGYYWGTTVVVVTQCDGQPPFEFFLYGGHAKELHGLLSGILKKHKQSKKEI